MHILCCLIFHEIRCFPLTWKFFKFQLKFLQYFKVPVVLQSNTDQTPSEIYAVHAQDFTTEIKHKTLLLGFGTEKSHINCERIFRDRLDRALIRIPCWVLASGYVSRTSLLVLGFSHALRETMESVSTLSVVYICTSQLKFTLLLCHLNFWDFEHWKLKRHCNIDNGHISYYNVPNLPCFKYLSGNLEIYTNKITIIHRHPNKQQSNRLLNQVMLRVKISGSTECMSSRAVWSLLCWAWEIS